MRELKIFLVVAVFTALVYWGVEPYAHSVMKPHVSPANFTLSVEDTSFAKSVVQNKESDLNLAKADLAKIQEKYGSNESLDEIKAKLEPINAKIKEFEDIATKDASKSKEMEQNIENLKQENASLFEIFAGFEKINAAQKALDKASKHLFDNEQLWAQVEHIDFAKGDASKGAEVFQGVCIACHGLSVEGLPSPISDSSLGVIPPDLSSAGMLYPKEFLAALILNPSIALKVDHKFGDAFIMTAYNQFTMDESEETINANIADMIAYLEQASKTYAQNFENNATSVLKEKYAKMQDLDELSKENLMQKELLFAKERNTFVEACGRCHDMKYDGFKSSSAKGDLKGYLGSLPPDLSMMIRSRGVEYLNNFINNTQKLLPGTAMPRVGLSEEAQKSVVSYMEKVGDSKKEERESTGIYIMIFFVILSVFAIAWKRQIWSKLH